MRASPINPRALSRYGIGEADWNLIRNTVSHEPRPDAVLVRPMDVAEGAAPAHRAAAEKFQRMIDTEMDYAVIEGDPVTRALMIGDSQPGSLGGETRRAVGVSRSFPATFVMMHFSRAAARGWDGTRLSHSALAFAAMTALGALSMQTKEIASGWDPLSLDPTTGNGLRAWGKANSRAAVSAYLAVAYLSTRPSRVIPGPPRWLVRWRHLAKHLWRLRHQEYPAGREGAGDAFCEEDACMHSASNSRILAVVHAAGVSAGCARPARLDGGSTRPRTIFKD